MRRRSVVVVANGGRVDSRIFGSFSVMHVAMDARLMLDHVPGISNDDTRGLRASVGANWADHVVGDGTCGKNTEGGCGILGVFIPQQAELVWERDGGSSRMGINLSWGI